MDTPSSPGCAQNASTGAPSSKDPGAHRKEIPPSEAGEKSWKGWLRSIRDEVIVNIISSSLMAMPYLIFRIGILEFKIFAELQQLERIIVVLILFFIVNFITSTLLYSLYSILEKYKTRKMSLSVMVLFSAIAALILVFFIPSIRDIWKITPTPIPPATDTPPPPPTQPPVVMLTLEAEAYGKGAPGQTVSSKARCSLNGRRYRPNVDELTSPSLHYELRHVDNGGRDWVCVLIEHPSSGIELILDGRDDTNDYDWCEVGVDLDVVKGYDSGDVKIWMGQGITAENCQTESWCP